MFVLFGSATSDLSAQTDPAQWTWTQVRNSVGNLVALNGHWGWNHAEYYPYSAAMNSSPWALLRWAFPALAAMGTATARRSSTIRHPKALGYLGLVVVVLLFLCKGLHPPLASVNLWLFRVVPGMWLFREPMSKFGVMVVLCYAILAGAVVERWITPADRPTGRPIVRPRVRPSVRPSRSRYRTAWIAAVPALVIGALAYPWPLWTGAVVSEQRSELPAAQVTIPEAWYRTADAVNRSPSPGRLLELPIQDYYQVTTTWGYHGIDNVPQQLVDRPVLQSIPGGYFDLSADTHAMLDALQDDLVGHATAAAQHLLATLDVSHVVVRRDLADVPGSTPRPAADALSAGLRAIPGVRLALGTPVGDLFELHANAVTVHGRATAIAASDPRDTGRELAGVPVPGLLTDDPQAAATAAHVTVTARRPALFSLDTAGDYRVTRSAAAGWYTAAEVPGGVRLDDAVTARVADHTVPGAPSISVSGDRRPPAALRVGTTVYDWPIRQPIRVDPHRVVTVLSSDGVDLARGDRAYPGPRCGPPDPTPHPMARVTRVTRAAGIGPDAWRVTSNSGVACVSVPVLPPKTDTVRLRIRTRTATGTPPRICLWQDAAAACVLEKTLSPTAGWTDWSGSTAVHPGKPLSVYLYADGVSGHLADEEYEITAVSQLAPNGTAVAPAPGWRPGTVRLNAGPNAAIVTTAGDGARAVDMRDCDGGAAGPPSADPSAATVPQWVLHATTRMSCLYGTVSVGPGSGDYVVGFDYRSLSGAAPRFCVWQAGTGTCVASDPLPATSSWQHLETTVHPAPGTQSLQLFLYADPQVSPRTEVAYRAPTFRPVVPVALDVQPASVPAAHDSVPAWSQIGVGRYSATIQNPGDGTVVELAEGYSPDWRITGLAAGWSASHFRADGYANAWTLHGHGAVRMNLVLEYAPQRWLDEVRRSSLLLLAVLVVTGFRRPAFRAARSLRRRLERTRS
ncbi:hypothetical protein ACFQ9X_50820 [Catenulispora yoronensis]